MSGATDRPVKLACRHVWKVFGPDAAGQLGDPAASDAAAVERLRDSGHIPAVVDAGFDVHAGEIFVIMGLSGSGKSTLLRCLSRLVEPTAGQVLLDGADLLAASAAELVGHRRRTMGMVFQSFGLLPHRTVLENVAFPLEMRGQDRHERRARALEVIELVGLDGREDYYPRELSGGQQQRVGIARSLAIEPDIWFLDEPFSALDPLIRRQLQDEFRQLTKELGKSAVFITHDLDEAIRIGDRIAIMKDGALIQVGTAEDIVMDPADQYVADFVAGISRLHLIKAHSVMVPVADWDEPLDDLPRCDPEADIDALIAQITETSADALAVEEDGRVVGVVSVRNLLLGVRGEAGADPFGAEA